MHELDLHINDPEFADEVAEALLAKLPSGANRARTSDPLPVERH